MEDAVDCLDASEDEAVDATIGDDGAFVDISPSQVIERIEFVIESYFNVLAEGELPSLTFVRSILLHLVDVVSYTLVPQASRQARHASYVEQGNQYALRMQHAEQERTLDKRNAEGAFAYVRLVKVLGAVHEMLQEGRQVTQRGLYYRLLNPPIIASPVYAAMHAAIRLRQ